MVAELTYVNEQGLKCFCKLNNPNEVHHSWWSSKRNLMGKYDKHEVTVLGYFLSKIKNCTEVKVKVYEDR